MITGAWLNQLYKKTKELDLRMLLGIEITSFQMNQKIVTGTIHLFDGFPNSPQTPALIGFFNGIWHDPDNSKD